jgi:ectoine hydroxylase-related dioxygenase (phytanoyl-CoA dioxygenase family)
MTTIAEPSKQNRLSAETIDAYEKDGFFIVNDVFPPSDVERLRAAAAASNIVSEQERRGGEGRTVHLLGLTSFHAAFLELACDQRILRLITPLIGGDIQLQHSKLATKPPKKNTGPYPWHQDFAFYPHTNTSVLSVMVMLDDATPDNGCMRMVRGSHRQGLFEHRVDGFFSGRCVEENRWADPETLVDITPRAGGVSVHHCLTLHGSDVNLSGNPRRGVVFSYRADDAHQLANNLWDDSGLLISGCRRGVVRCETGRWLLPAVSGRPNLFGTVWSQQGARATAYNQEHGPLTQPKDMPAAGEVLSDLLRHPR